MSLMDAIHTASVKHECVNSEPTESAEKKSSLHAHFRYNRSAMH